MRGRKPQHIRIDRNALMELPPPEDMAEDAADEWRRTLPILAERRVMTEADLAMFESYCVMVGIARRAERDINENGISAQVFRLDKDGNAVLTGWRKNPAMSVLSDAINKARLLAAELGCTPASRSRPSIEENNADQRDLWSEGLIDVKTGGRA